MQPTDIREQYDWMAEKRLDGIFNYGVQALNKYIFLTLNSNWNIIYEGAQSKMYSKQFVRAIILAKSN